MNRNQIRLRLRTARETVKVLSIADSELAHANGGVPCEASASCAKNSRQPQFHGEPGPDACFGPPRDNE